jgi:farnesol dehydrogenase
LDHLASVVDYWQRDPQRFIEVNVQGTENLLAAARNAGVERVLICSSCGIFGPSPDGKLIDETTRVNLDKLGSYEQSKFLQRKLALQYNSRSLQTVIAYPTRVFGPACVSGTSALTQILQKAVRQRRCFVPGKGHNVGNYVFVDDVVKGLILVMDKAFAGEEFIIGGANLTYVQLIQHLERATHRSISIWRIPKPVLKMVAYLELLRSILFRTRPGITVQAVDKYAADWPVSIAKAQRELGYEPLEIKSALESTLDEDWLA